MLLFARGMRKVIGSSCQSCAGWGSSAEDREMQDRKDDFVVSDAVTDLEQAFPLKDLLALEYFSRHRDGYYRCREEGWQIPHRNYYNLLQYLREIYEYREQDARTFAKTIRGSAADMPNSDATFAEIIVYRHYI
jgi:hypothetical protein